MAPKMRSGNRKSHDRTFFLSAFVMACNRDDQVKHLEIQPQNGERKSERRLPLIFLGQSVVYNVVNRVEVANQEKRGDDDENHTEHDAQDKILTQRGYHRLCEGNEGADKGEQRNGDDRDEQRQHDHLEFLRHADNARGIQDCHHHNNQHGN